MDQNQVTSNSAQQAVAQVQQAVNTAKSVEQVVADAINGHLDELRIFGWVAQNEDEVKAVGSYLLNAGLNYMLRRSPIQGHFHIQLV